MKYRIEKKIVIIGMGRLGTSVALGFLKAGVNPDQIVFIQHNKGSKEHILGTQVFDTLEQAGIDENIELIIIAVKPKDIGSVLIALDQNVDSNIPIVSLVAQVTVEELKQTLTRSSHIFRIKPNVLIQYDRGCILINKNQMNDPIYAKVRSIFSQLGDIFELTEEKLETYTWYAIHIPCVFFPKLIQSMFEKESELEKEQLLAILISGLEGLLEYLKNFPEPSQSINEYLDTLPQQTMSPHGLNHKAFCYLEDNNVLTIINEAREVYCQFGLNRSK